MKKADVLELIDWHSKCALRDYAGLQKYDGIDSGFLRGLYSGGFDTHQTAAGALADTIGIASRRSTIQVARKEAA